MQFFAKLSHNIFFLHKTLHVFDSFAKLFFFAKIFAKYENKFANLFLNINVSNIKILYLELRSICRFTLPTRKYIEFANSINLWKIVLPVAWQISYYKTLLCVYCTLHNISGFLKIITSFSLILVFIFHTF